MRRNAALSLLIGYFATYHKFFTEPMTGIERAVATLAIGIIVFGGLLKTEERREQYGG